MKLTIGRDENTQRLKVTIEGGQTRLFGSPGSVPMSVSRQHCLIQIDDGGGYMLTNLKLQNVTSVNGLPVQSKRVTDKDTITLGAENYQLDWQYIKSMMPAVADIRPLKKVWTDYEQETMRQVIAERKFTILKGATGIITLSAILLGALVTKGNKYYLALYAIAIGLSVAFTIKAYTDVKKNAQKSKNRKQQFNHDYVCPHCGRGLKMCGSYEELVRDYDACPRCKAKFIK